MNHAELIQEALRLPPDAIAYFVSRELARLFPDRSILEASTCPFGLEKYSQAGLCQLEKSPLIHTRMETQWHGTGYGLTESADGGWYLVQWQGHLLEVMVIAWVEGFSKKECCWIIADAKDTAETFYRTVCEWNAEVRGEILVFEGGGWQKSQELYDAVQSATFDTLILPPKLKEEIQSDFAHFFGSREVYARYNIPWKRGVLLLGTPGNGKTHTVKALINQSRQPCLYVKSFKSEYDTDHDNIRKVFQRARQTTPCILVLEDLDSLIDGTNRAFFLNEMDGFASNAGIVTLATTNHPERLDPAILDRPSRFDRKYQFELPAPAERHAFLLRWNEQVEATMRLPKATLAEAVSRTEGYSFAYLKELWLSSMMRWISNPQKEDMYVVFTAQIDVLRVQMQADPGDEAPGLETDSDPTLDAMATMRSYRYRGRHGR